MCYWLKQEQVKKSDKSNNHEDAFSEEETRLGQAASKVTDTKVALK